MTKLDILDDVRIASPCDVPWGAMTGDKHVRFCDKCSKNVYDLTALPRSEAVELVERNEMGFCARLHRRKDGTIITADCPVGRRRRLRRISAAVLAGSAFAFFGVWVRASGQSKQSESACESEEGWAGFQWSAPSSGPDVEFQDYMTWAKECLGLERRPEMTLGMLIDESSR
ncbi:MAG: hypothetical protein NVSMB14_06150 [Isosphaeraceae bacterium]